MDTDVFISYSRRDEDFVKRLYQELTSRDIQTWYDRENIRVGKHWPSEIVEGIRDCTVFLLSLSPDAAASVNVRKEVDLAQRYKKQIIPLIWRTTEIPVAMQYQLAGTQWIEFNQTATPEKFDELVRAISLFTGKAVPPAAPEEKEPESPTTPVPVLKRRSKMDAAVTGALVIAGVVTTLELDQTDDFEAETTVNEESEVVSVELDWVFNAADHLLKIRDRQINPTQPTDEVSAMPPFEFSIPPKKIINPGFARAFAPKIENLLKTINIRLKNLDRLVLREAQLGEAALENLGLQTDLSETRLEIMKDTKELALLMKKAYGVSVNSPNQLIQRLSEGTI